VAVLRVLEIFNSLQGEGYWTGVPMTFVRLACCNAPELGLGCARWCDTQESWDRAGGEALDAAEVARRTRLPRLCLTGGEPLLQGEGVAQLVAEARRRGTLVHVETNGTLDPLGAFDRPVAGDRPATAGLPRTAGQPRRGPQGERPFDWATVSPKPPGYLVAPGWAGLVDELKLVAEEQLDAATAERLAAAHPEAVVSIQPLWETGRAGSTDRGPVAGGVDSAARVGRDSIAGAALGGGDWQGAGTALGEAAAERAMALVMAHPEWRLSLQIHKFLGVR
jgi:organic radical activating enzyme